MAGRGWPRRAPERSPRPRRDPWPGRRRARFSARAGGPVGQPPALCRDGAGGRPLPRRDHGGAAGRRRGRTGARVLRGARGTTRPSARARAARAAGPWARARGGATSRHRWRRSRDPTPCSSWRSRPKVGPAPGRGRRSGPRGHAPRSRVAQSRRGPERRADAARYRARRPSRLQRLRRRPTSPRLDHFAARSVVFASAISQAPWTRPSHRALLTGLYPLSSRGARRCRWPRRCAVTATSRPRSPAVATSMPASASGAGSRPTGWSTGLRDGASSTAWMVAARSRPSFLFLHTYEPHDPYMNAELAQGLPPGRVKPGFSRADWETLSVPRGAIASARATRRRASSPASRPTRRSTSRRSTTATSPSPIASSARFLDGARERRVLAPHDRRAHQRSWRAVLGARRLAPRPEHVRPPAAGAAHRPSAQGLLREPLGKKAVPACRRGSPTSCA